MVVYSSEEKIAFVSQPTFYHPDPTRPFIIGTDAYDVALGVLLLVADTLLHLILLGVLLIKLITAEKIYTLLDKELLATEATYESW